MTYQEFRDYVEENFWIDDLEEGFSHIDPVMKNNDVELWKLSVDLPGRNVSPALYLEDYYGKVVRGDPAEHVLREMEQTYTMLLSGRQVKEIELAEDILDRRQIVFNLVHYAMNKKRLKDCPIIRVMDLAVEFRFVTSIKDKAIGSVLINNEIMEKMELDREELIRLAMENTMRIFPPVVLDMEEFSRRIFGDLFSPEGFSIMRPDEIEEGQVMYILTNKHMVNGASAMLCENVLKTMAERLKSNLMILPSSVHEIIIVPVDNIEDTQASVAVVRQVNGSMMDPEDILSYSVYYYDRKNDTLMLAQEETP